MTVTKRNNFGPIAGMRLSHKVFDLSLDLFVTLYLWNETGQDLGLLCLYRSIFSACVFAAMLSFVYLSRAKGRKWIMAGGRCMLLGYIVLLTALGHESVRYIPLLSAIHGIGTGMHYIIYNQYEAEGISGDLSGRSRFVGLYESASAILKAAYPFLAGLLMDKFGILPVCIFSAVSTLSVILFSALYDDQGCGRKVSFTAYFSFLKSDKAARDGAKGFMACDFFRAFTCSYASLSLFLSVCLMSFSNGAGAFGLANSVLFLFSVMFGILFKRIATQGQSFIWKGQKILLFVMLIAGVSMFNPYEHINLAFTIFMFAWNFYLTSESMVYSTATGMFAKNKVSLHITECFVVNEGVLTAGRLIGYGCLWLFWEKFGSLLPSVDRDAFTVSFPCLLFVLYMGMVWLSFLANQKLWQMQTDNT